MNILLIYPETPGTFWNFKHILKFIGRKAAFPPLGLLTVASILPSEWNKKLIDLNVSQLTDEDITWADLILISAMIIQEVSANKVIARCRKQNKIILAGGPLFTALPEKFSEVDHIIIGEAENTLPQFIDDWKKGQAKKIYRFQGWPDILTSPAPLWSLIRLRDYVTITVQFSRGCPFDCEFCDIVVLNGRKPRTKSAEQFISELEGLYQADWRGAVFIADDNLIGNKNQVKSMLRALITWQEKRNFPFSFLTQTSVNLADDDELLDLMSRANFFKVFLGLESPNDSSLEECHKNQNLKSDIAASVKKIHRYGMQVMAGFIIGFDHDPDDIFEQQKSFIESLGISVAMIGLLTALPETRLFKRLKQEGRLTGESSGENTNNINFIPKMDKELMLKKYRELIKKLYGARSYYGRIDTFIKDYHPTLKGKRISYQDIKALLMSMLLIGIFSSAAYHYWKLLIKTLLLKPRALSAAVELAIQGYHFKRMAWSL